MLLVNVWVSLMIMISPAKTITRTVLSVWASRLQTNQQANQQTNQQCADQQRFCGWSANVTPRQTVMFQWCMVFCWEIIIIKQTHTFTSNILFWQRRFGMGCPRLREKGDWTFTTPTFILTKQASVSQQVYRSLWFARIFSNSAVAGVVFAFRLAFIRLNLLHHKLTL